MVRVGKVTVEERDEIRNIYEKINALRNLQLIVEEENLYKNEVENFIKYYIDNDKNVIKGTTIGEGVTALKLIDEMRKSMNSN